jgi:AcrR family transcriptional regulator
MKRTSEGREQQRRRTRRAILDATIRLMARGADSPSIDEIAEEAEVSRRTVYMYYPTAEQLHLDATLGALAAPAIDLLLLEAPDDTDVAARVEKLAREMLRVGDETMSLGRRLIRLTVDDPAPAPDAEPRRGHRRVQWIETALAPLRARLSRAQHERLVSGLTLLLGWEAMIQLRSMRALGKEAEARVIVWAARALVQATLAEAERGKKAARTRRV